VDDERNNPGNADGIDGARLAALFEPQRGFVTTLEQIAAVYDRLAPGPRRRLLERVYELLRENADNGHAIARTIHEYMRRYP